MKVIIRFNIGNPVTLARVFEALETTLQYILFWFCRQLFYNFNRYKWPLMFKILTIYRHKNSELRRLVGQGGGARAPTCPPADAHVCARYSRQAFLLPLTIYFGETAFMDIPSTFFKVICSHLFQFHSTLRAHLILFFLNYEVASLRIHC